MPVIPSAGVTHGSFPKDVLKTHAVSCSMAEISRSPSVFSLAFPDPFIFLGYSLAWSFTFLFPLRILQCDTIAEQAHLEGYIDRAFWKMAWKKRKEKVQTNKQANIIYASTHHLVHQKMLKIPFSPIGKQKEFLWGWNTDPI